jgi:hypothetical protein
MLGDPVPRPFLLALSFCALFASCAAPRREERGDTSSAPVEAAPQKMPAHEVSAAPESVVSGADAEQATPAEKEPVAEPSPQPETEPGAVAPADQSAAAAEQVVAGAEAAPSGQESSGQEAAAPESAAPGTAPAESTSTTASTADASPQLLHGSLALRYRGRATSDDQDHDVRALLTLDLVDPRSPWISGHMQARLDGDLDGQEEDEVFQDLNDTWDSDLVAKLYLAYADVALARDPAKSPGTLRIGRQSDVRLPEVLRLDGVSYRTRPLGARELEVGLYGGVPVHLYESSSEGDQAYGTFIEGRPWAAGRVRFDWMHLEDEVALGAERDDLLALGLWQELAERWRLEGELTRLEGEPRDLRLRALYDDPDTYSLARVSYYELQDTQVFRTQELDPFSEQLLEYFPYRQGSLNVSRAFGAHAVLDLGFDVRRVSDADDVGEFNREWERYYATATWHDAPVEGLALSLTGDLWDDDERDTNALGADLSYDHEPWRTALGTYYSLYKYELLELAEREDVRTYYARAERAISARLRLDVLYEFEDDDLDTYHTLRLGAIWRF